MKAAEMDRGEFLKAREVPSAEILMPPEAIQPGPELPEVLTMKADVLAEISRAVKDR